MGLQERVLAYFKHKKNGQPPKTIRLTTEWEQVTFRQYRGICLLPFRNASETERQLMLLEILSDYALSYADILALDGNALKILLREAQKSAIIQHPQIPDFVKDVTTMPGTLKTPDGPVAMPRSAAQYERSPTALIMNQGAAIVECEEGLESELDLMARLTAMWVQWKVDNVVNPAELEAHLWEVERSPARLVIRAGFFFRRLQSSYTASAGILG